MSKSVLVPVEHRWRQVSDGYQKLNLRERALVSLSLMAVTWMVWNVTIGGFLEEAKARIHRDVNTAYAEMQQEVAEQSRLQKAENEDPNERLNRERATLGLELENLDENLAAALERFVAPEKMPSLLKDVIRHHDGLKLKRIASLPVEAIELEKPPDPEDQTPSPVIYRHPLRLEFQGNYFEVLSYLAELEEGDWKFGWRSLSYVVEDYPVAVVTLEIETLSRERSWIGV